MTFMDPAGTALLRTASRPFDEAVAMSPEPYTSEAFLAREVETIFAREWICVGRASALAMAGDYLTCEIAGQPIIVLRDRDGRLRAMSNVCLHRMSTLLEGAGNVRAIVCPYHAWSYNLDGTMRGAPLMNGRPGFCKDEYRLPDIRCEDWLGWIYVTLDADAVPVADRLRPLEQMIAPYGMERYVECFRETHVWDTNWKILAENFMESYHLPVCHARTVGPHSKLEEMDCPPGLAAFNYHWITKEASLAIGNAHPANTRLTGHWRRTTGLITIYPSHLITLTPGYFWYLSLHPEGVGKVRMIFGGGLSPEFIDDPQGQEYVAALKALLDAVNVEDRRCTEKVFRGMQATRATPGRLSHLERPLYDFTRYLAGRTVGFDPASGPAGGA
ncbi:aromatic ring-hydroxylating oxygenase subunit alpha [Gluconacetobacter tumulisoli]|uniref:Rieske 2Fe-2S domain-containing protein n=1 Tax=Gluconacetobacter tumulisoli TaxID=1286189 RepID=A0A7W4K702_9PROT|nr:SRPBCC family protein [Gluconacetobacter tumulisoli]MBB2201539.1 Rieske 2Fe-2S domain-containing protein [Gluconacetobacter tumulisoli]